MKAGVVVAWAYRFAIAAVSRLFAPVPKRRRVLFLSRESDTPSPDFEDIGTALRRLDPSIEVRCLTKRWVPGGLGQIRYLGPTLRQLWAQARARVVVVDTYSPVVSCGRRTRRQRAVQIWHALGAFKRFGLSILDQPGGRGRSMARAMRMHEGYDVVLISAEPCRAAYAEALGTDPTRLRVAPLPRVDRLTDPARRAATRDRILAVRPDLENAHVALYAPTIHPDGTASATDSQVTALARALAAHGWTLLYGAHPVVRRKAADAGPPAGRYPDHSVAGGPARTGGTASDTGRATRVPGFTTADLMAVADAFVTDYSSALFEAAVSGLPCYFLAPDAADFTAGRGFYLDPAGLPGPLSRTPDETAAQIAAGTATSQAALAFARTWVEVPGGAGTTRCADAIARLLADQL
jgi:CDP-glycerol glycerophosphotransferase (TagB/SpsB family)